jgi:YegS/Rv2252/BmrU family lipid kinase
LKVRAIFNPIAGVAAHRMLQAVERGRPSWGDYAVYLTREPGHATELAREAVVAGADLVLAVGGDGTVNEVAQGLLGTSAALGVVPAGSGNGLARALRIPLRPEGALDALEAGLRRRMDACLLNRRLFLNVAGAGFDAVVGGAFHDSGRRGGRRGLFGYVRLGLRELLSYQATKVTLHADGSSHELTPFVLTFANGPQYGSGAVINPGARLDDGRLEVVAFECVPLPAIMAAASRLFLGGIERARPYRRFAVARATVAAVRPVAVHRDGDPDAAADRIDIELLPRALEIVVPAATARDPAGPFTPGDSPDPRQNPAWSRRGD